MNIDFNLLVPWIGLVIAFALLIRNFFKGFRSIHHNDVKLSRMEQLQKNSLRKKEVTTDDLIEKISEPIIKNILPYFGEKNMLQLKKDLKLAKWDKKFTPLQFHALVMGGKILGIILLVILAPIALPIGLLWGVTLFFAPTFLLDTFKDNRKEALLSDFPDLIRITEGYLAANMPLQIAMERSMQYMGSEWQPILKDFVLNCETNSMRYALDKMKEDVDIFEVKEFISIVNLTLEQGGDAKEGFSAQADKLIEIKQNILEIKIGKRQAMGVVLQGPLLVCILATFALPVVDSMSSFTTM